MRRSQLCLVLVVVGALLWVRSPVLGQGGEQPERQDYIFVGADLGGTGPLSPLDRFANNGFVLAPYGGYMFNKFIGVMGQVHWLGMPNEDACKPSGHPDYNPQGCYGNKPLEDDWTWALGATVGPRVALPLGGIEIWGTFQGGGFTGFSGDSPINDGGWAFSTGGGVNIDVTQSIALGGFARYNRIYQDVHLRGDARYASGGISLTYKFTPGAGAPPEK